MASSYSFRSSLSGFNREDVVHYLEYINTKNANALAQLEGELESARKEIRHLQEAEDWKARVEALEQENAALRQEMEALQAKQAEVTTFTEEELEAYRRAERMERQVKLRTEQLCQKANGILADTGVKMDESIANLALLAEQTAQQLQLLQQAMVSGKAVLQEGAIALRTVRTED